MVRAVLHVSIALVLGLALPVALGAEGDVQTFAGRFKWNDGPSGDLEARFTETADGRFKVDFHFTFRGDAHVYSGTAEGSLTAGGLSGTVLNDDKRRTFTFSGEFQDGKFAGNHAELLHDGPEPTGTLTLAR